MRVMRLRRCIGLCLLIMLVSTAASARVFQWVDRFGNKHYSDRPHSGAEVVNIRPGYGYYRVKKIFDGDTVLLTDGQKVRLLGINAPEVAHRNHPAEPGGEEATQWLTLHVAQQKIRLEMDVEKKDKYGRILAHVFTERGVHINLELVKYGLATVALHPPNLLYSRVLLAAQDSAEKAGLGIWRRPYFARKSYRDIRDTRGWKRVVGKVMHIKHTPYNSYLAFSDDFSLKVARRDAKLFPTLKTYLGHTIEARGWLYRRKKSWTMPLRHPGQVKFLDQP